MSGELGLSAGQLSKVLGCPDPAQLEQHGHENQHAGGAGSMPAQPAHGMTSSSRAALPPGVNLPDNSDNSAPSSKRARIDEKESQRKALDAFLGKGNSVMERMQLTGLQGDPSGLEVQNAIFKQFQVGERRTLPWYKADGKTRNIWRHHLNLRKVGNRVKTYAASIKEKGILQGVRGEPWVVYDPSSECYLCISYGSLTDAFYQADSESPDNAMVKMTREQGLQQARVLDHRCPEEILTYLRDLHNAFHGGLGVTYHDCVMGSEECEQGWKSFCEFKGYTHRNCKIQKEMYSYVKENWSNRYRTGQMFDLSRKVNRDLKELECRDQWDQYFGSIADFPEGESTLSVLENMASLTFTLATAFLSSYPSSLLSLVCLEACKFLVSLTPTESDSRRLPDPTPFQKHNPAMFERFKVPISGASFIKKIFRGRKKMTELDATTSAGADGDQQSQAMDGDDAIGAQNENTSNPGRGRGRGRAKGKAKAKAKSKSKGQDDQDEQQEDVTSDVKINLADQRPRWWLDDLIGCLVHASRRSPDAIVEDPNLRKAFQECISYGIEFCFYKVVIVNGKTLKSWSQVRPQLQQMLRQVHSMIPMTSSEEMVQSLLAKIRSSQEQPAGSVDTGYPKDLPVAALQSEHAAALCQQWIAANQGRDLGKHPGFARCISKLSEALCCCGSGSSGGSKFCPCHGNVAPLTLSDLFFHVASCVYDHIPEMVPFFALGASLINELREEAVKNDEDPMSWPSPASFLVISEDVLDPTTDTRTNVKKMNKEAVSWLMTIRVRYMTASFQAVFDALSRKSADPMLQSIGIPFDKFQKILALLQVTCATSSDHAAVMKSATEAGIQTDKVDKETMAFYSGFIESALCTQGADASTWANSWAMVIQKVHTSCSLLPLKALFPEQSSADKPTIGTIEQPAGETPGEKSVKNEASSPLAHSRDNKRGHPAVKRCPADQVDWDNDRISLAQVYGMSKLYLDEDPSTGMYDTSLNVLDLLAIQREIETELFKTAMRHAAVYQKIYVDFSKNTVMALLEEFKDTDKIYIFGSVGFEPNSKSIKVASLSLPNFKHNPDDPEKKGKIDFFVSPNSFDKVTSAAPCAPWIMKTASTTRADSDNESDGDDDNCHFKLQTTDVKVSVLSMTSKGTHYEVKIAAPYLAPKTTSSLSKKAQKKRKRTEGEYVTLCRPAFLTKKQIKALSSVESSVSYGGKLASSVFKDSDNQPETTSKKNDGVDGLSLLSTLPSRDVGHLLS